VFWDYTPDQNNLITRSTHHVVAVLYDEAGGGAIAGNVFWGYEVTYTQTEDRP
jgi:hypothetical protein